jgi:ribosomal protein S18 acetylase RimI-like enzyme
LIALLAGSDPWLRLGYTAADWRRLLGSARRGREVWVVEEDGVARGLAVVRKSFLAGDYLELLAVSAPARKRGLGGRLLAHVERVVFARAPNLFVCVSDFNRAARRFYRRQGYVAVGRLEALLVEDSAEILLRKSTRPLRSARQSRNSQSDPVSPTPTVKTQTASRTKSG